MKRLSPYFSFLLIPLLVNLPVAAQLPDQGASDAAPEALQIRVLDNNPGPVAVNSQTSKGLLVQITNSEGAPVADAAVALRLPDDGPTGAFADGSHAAVAYTDRAGRAQLASVKWGDTPGVVAMRLTTVKGTAHAGILVDEQIVEQILKTASQEAVATSVPASPLPNAPVPVAQLAAPPPSSSTPAATPAAAANHPLLPAAAPPLKPEPTVSVTNTANAKTSSHSHKKWIIIAAIAAGAGAGLAFAGKGKSSSSAAPAPSLSIGSPTVSVGHP